MLTSSHGHPIDDKTTTLTGGESGPVLIQDFIFFGLWLTLMRADSRERRWDFWG